MAWPEMRKPTSSHFRFVIDAEIILFLLLPVWAAVCLFLLVPPRICVCVCVRMRLRACLIINFMSTSMGNVRASANYDFREETLFIPRHLHFESPKRARNVLVIKYIGDHRTIEKAIIVFSCARGRPLPPTPASVHKIFVLHSFRCA